MVFIVRLRAVKRTLLFNKRCKSNVQLVLQKVEPLYVETLLLLRVIVTLFLIATSFSFQVVTDQEENWPVFSENLRETENAPRLIAAFLLPTF